MTASSSEPLHQKTCQACQAGAPQVTDQEAETLLNTLPGWSIIDTSGTKQLIGVFKFKNFVAALDFTNKVGEEAEKENHHPEIRTEWGKTTVLWWTHKIHGLHMNDFVMAARTSQIYQRSTTKE
ncbi:4a-hydroxytetrahydrobiopterin dehydratase [Litoribacillus peritrichatus]|uniref:Putative pterin-4-alpha-carbinolamine dehydratase n=1 Tax=Litoribacillus peritrichatus TaxID=718191 RepID=A0ABP7MIJ1_9GAMM